MTCQEFIDFLLDYDEGVLPPEQRGRFDAHLAVCLDCVNYLASYRAAKALGKAAFSAGNEPLPAEVPAELIQAILFTRKHAK